MDTHRRDPLDALLCWQGELPELIQAIRQCRAPATIAFDRGHAAAALEKTLAGLATPDQLVTWAQTVHFQEEVDMEEGYEDLLTRFLFEVSTPELFEPVTAATCQRWLHLMHTAEGGAT